MKRVILFSLLAIALTSCGTAPQEKYDTAKHCVDSLYKAGAGNSQEYDMLKETMANVDERCEIRQNLIDGNNDKLPEFVQDWLKPRRVIKADNRRVVIAIRMVEGIMVKRFTYLHQHA